MKPSQMVEEEHRQIGRALRLIKIIAERMEVGGEIDPKMIDDLLFFLTEFADICHLGKEEQALFPAVEKKGDEFSRDFVKALLADHRVGREHIAAMVQANKAYDRGEFSAVESLTQAMLDYVSLATRHISAENGTFLDMLDGLFADDEAEELVKRCEKIEEELPAGRIQLLEILNRVNAQLKEA
ncbi:MAG: hemerythrin domain-containing protein [Actinobacteria bacterium]|nr:hemerythrin domain-containing protein [Actinomycetota bacterium]